MKSKPSPSVITPGQPLIKMMVKIAKFNSTFTDMVSHPEFVSFKGDSYVNNFKMEDINFVHEVVIDMNTESEKYGILFSISSLSRISSCAATG